VEQWKEWRDGRKGATRVEGSFFRSVGLDHDGRDGLACASFGLPLMQELSTRRKAVAALLGAALLWSLGGLLIKSVQWSPLAIAGTRSAIAALVLLLVLGKPRFTWSFAQLGGAVAYAATVILFVTATKMTTAANAILLQYTAPVYVALFGPWFLKERSTRADWTTIAVVMGGMLLFFMDRLSPEGFWGNLVAIASGIAFAWLTLFMRKQKTGSPWESVLLGNIITAVVCLPFYLGPGPGASGWVALTILGIFQLGFSYILYSKAIKHVPAVEAMLISIIEPILNPVWVLLAMGEQPGAWSLAGGAVVLSALTFRTLWLSLKSSSSQRA
jgi:drug/metabolite transporter (DMT)-like permease